MFVPVTTKAKAVRNHRECYQEIYMDNLCMGVIAYHSWRNVKIWCFRFIMHDVSYVYNWEFKSGHNKELKIYFTQLLEQCNGGTKRYGTITDIDELKENLQMNCIPDGIEQFTVEDYQDFLAERRRLLASKIKTYFLKL